LVKAAKGDDMSAITRRTLAQGVATAAVLVSGIVSVATSGGAAAATGAAATAEHPVASHQGGPADPTSHVSNPAPDVVIPAHRAPKVHVAHIAPRHLTHPAHESWSRLLVAPQRGWSVTHAAMTYGVKALSKEFAVHQAASRELRFDGFRRGVVEATTGAHTGIAEELWQFRRPTGAAAWYIGYSVSNRPGPRSIYSHSFAIGRDGDRGFLADHTDASGYHFGVGTALEGDMMIEVRVFGTAQITRTQVTQALRRATRPVARGITVHGLQLTTAPAGTPSLAT
jgi:hypothetical protein